MVKLRTTTVFITIILLLGITQQQAPMQSSAHVDVDFEMRFGSFNGPNQITQNNTHVLIGDRFDDVIKIFDLTGSLVDSFATDGFIGISVNETHIISSDTFNSQIHVYDFVGNEVDTFTNTSLDFEGITSNDSHILVSDTDNHVVHVFDRALNKVDTIGNGLGSGEGDFDFPQRVHMNSTHILVVDENNDRVQIFDLAGTYIDQFAVPNPYSITTIDDNILVTQSDAINIYDASGNFLESWGASGDALGDPRGLHSNGTHIYVSEYGNQRVTLLSFSPTTTETTTEISESTTTETTENTTTETTTETTEKTTTEVSEITITDKHNDSNTEGDTGALSTITVSTALFGGLIMIGLLRQKK